MMLSANAPTIDRRCATLYLIWVPSVQAGMHVKTSPTLLRGTETHFNTIAVNSWSSPYSFTASFSAVLPRSARNCRSGSPYIRPAEVFSFIVRPLPGTTTEWSRTNDLPFNEHCEPFLVESKSAHCCFRLPRVLQTSRHCHFSNTQCMPRLHHPATHHHHLAQPAPTFSQK